MTNHSKLISKSLDGLNLNLIEGSLTAIYLEDAEGNYTPVNRFLVYLGHAYGLYWDFEKLGAVYNPNDEYQVRKLHEWADKVLLPREIMIRLALAGNIPVEIHNNSKDDRITNRYSLEDYYKKMT